MLAAISTAWPLLLGIGLLMLGNGLQGTLLGVRATLEGFPTAITGIIMSCYYAGFLSGSVITPRVVSQVGHVRVFAALASLASASAIVHSIFLDPYSWGAMRLVTGFCFAGLYVVAESWLNDIATNETRGQLLSVYMVITLGGLAGGQLLLNFADPESFKLFAMISVLISVALVPTCLTASRTPSFDAPTPVGLIKLYHISPLGVVGSLITGTANGAFFGMGAVYAGNAGLSVAQISLFMGAGAIGGMLLQWPIGRISDRFDRRTVLTVTTFLAAVVAAAMIWLPVENFSLLLVAIAVFGGLNYPLYSLFIAHTNDFLEPDQRVAAASSLMLVIGIGAIIGPFAAATSMDVFGANGYFICLCVIHAAIGFFALYRMARRDAVPLEEQGSYVAMPLRATPAVAALSPEAEWTEDEEGADGQSEGDGTEPLGEDPASSKET